MSRQIFAALVCGVLFGAGLVVSDMINPARVLAFLDVAGNWDPSLALVMGGALVPSALGYAIRRRLRRPVLETAFHVPERRDIDGALVVGALLFGLGWGLVGLCPGPALAALVTGRTEPLLFVVAMLLGMIGHDRLGPTLRGRFFARRA